MGLLEELLIPSGSISLLLLLGAALLIFRPGRRIGCYLLVLAGCMYVLFATGPIAFWMLGNLEYQYPKVASQHNEPECSWIVVLAGYAERDPDRPLSSQVNSASAFRIIEAVRILEQSRDSRILMSGFGQVPAIMKELAVSLGVSPQRVSIDDESGSTFESAVHVKERLGDDRLYLVTSAGHMPRAMAAFTHAGLNPVPAPTDFRSKKNFLAIQYLPSPSHLEYSDLAVHEYLGLLWYKLNHRL